jgi:hypothetical protein
MVPARLLVKDRWELNPAASSLTVSSLWLLEQPKAGQTVTAPAAATAVPVSKTVVWLRQPMLDDPHFPQEIHRWLGDLHAHQ